MADKFFLEQIALEPNAERKLAQEMRVQPLRIPPAQLRGRIMDATYGKPWFLSGGLQWAAGIALAAVLWFVFAAIVQPGISLNWSAKVEQASTFRVYRAELNAAQFELIAEVPAQVGRVNYSYLDAQYFPGNTYQYQVEGVGASGILLHSVKITAGAGTLLPLYILLFLMSVAASYALVVLGGVVLRPGRLVTAG